MEKFLEILDKVIAIGNDVIEVKPRVTGTITEAGKILAAIRVADLGETTNAVVSKLAELTAVTQKLIG